MSIQISGIVKWVCVSVMLMLVTALAGCGGSGSSSTSQQLGVYSPPTSAANRARLGVAPFRVEIDSSIGQTDAAVGETTADTMADLLTRSGRFEVIDPKALKEMLQSQHTADMVKPGLFVHPADVHGVDYLLIGTVTNLTISKKAETPGVVDRVTDFVTRSGENKQLMVTATCGVGFNLIEPATGDVVLSNNSEFNRTAGAKDLGIDILASDSASESSALRITETDRRRIISLALDDAIRKSLPKIDRFLESRKGQSPLADSTPTPAPIAAPVAPQPEMKEAITTPPTTAPSPAAAPTAAPVSPSPAAAPSSTKKICSVCASGNDATAKFCKRCGAKLP